MAPLMKKQMGMILAAGGLMSAAVDGFSSPAFMARVSTNNVVTSLNYANSMGENGLELPYFLSNPAMSEATTVQSEEQDVLRNQASIAMLEAVGQLGSEESTTKTKVVGTKNKNRPASVATKARKGPNHKEGILSPLVVSAKKIIGDDQLNSLRAKAINIHSDTIKSFVDTYDSPVGRQVLEKLFAWSDKNRNGRMEKDELKMALEVLGFTWIKEKQLEGILNRSDVDGDGSIDFNEFVMAAPKTLKTNLVKLAKKNGGDLGLLV